MLQCCTVLDHRLHRSKAHQVVSKLKDKTVKNNKSSDRQEGGKRRLNRKFNTGRDGTIDSYKQSSKTTIIHEVED